MDVVGAAVTQMCSCRGSHVAVPSSRAPTPCTDDAGLEATTVKSTQSQQPTDSPLQHLAGRRAAREVNLERYVREDCKRAGRLQHAPALCEEAWRIKPAACARAGLTVEGTAPVRQLSQHWAAFILY